ncbi:MAG: oligosaccharide flippase family protein [Chloroflexota bacterium]
MTDRGRPGLTAAVAKLGAYGPVALLALLALAFVSPAALTGRALLPLDNLFLYPPWRGMAESAGVAYPHNPLIGDAILQNYSWKQLARDAFWRGELPLWNPYILSGEPFLGAAQNGALYPPGVFFYVLPLAQAYAWFIGLHLFLGAWGAYRLARRCGAGIAGGLLAGVAFGFCGFLVVSFLWPMVVSTAVWLPWLLLIVDRLAVGAKRASLTWLAGAIVVCLQFLAGHLEMSLYLLLTAGLYAAIRLVQTAWSTPRETLPRGAACLVMVVVGSCLAGPMLVPFGEAFSQNVRTGWSDYEESLSYAMPRERLIAYLVPDWFGNPTHRSYLDARDGSVRSVEHPRANGEWRWDTEWGGKNYVEGAVYLGIPTLALASLLATRRPRGQVLALALVAAVSLALAFGSPLYGLLFYGIPGVNQLHTPFRWIYPAGLCLAILAGISLSSLGDRRSHGLTLLGGLWLAGGVGIVGVTTLSMVAPDLFDPLAERAFRRFREARDGFANARAALSYLGLATLGSGLVAALTGTLMLLHARRGSAVTAALIIALLVGDLFSVGIGFNSAADPAVLSIEPPAITAIKTDAANRSEPFRVVTFGGDDTLPSNTNMLFGLEDVRGYDTLMLKHYVEYMGLIEPQIGVPYSKVAKLFREPSLASPLLDFLNVRYALTTLVIRRPGWTLLSDDGHVRVYRNERTLPRAFVIDSGIVAPDHASALRIVGDPAFDPRRNLVVEATHLASDTGAPGTLTPATIVERSPSRVVVETDAPHAGYLVLADTYFDGWTATVDGAPTGVLRANGVARAAQIPPGRHRVAFELRPLSVRLGGLLAAVCLAILVSVAAWPVWRRLRTDAQHDDPGRRVLANTTFPMLTSLVNKAADVAFALIMFRLLGAEGVGVYTFAGVIFGYLDIVVGYGFATLITRDVARDPSLMGRYLGSTWLARLGLLALSALLNAAITGPLAALLGVERPLAVTLWLLWSTLIPGMVSGGLTAVFFARELNVYPAAITLLSTALKVGLGTIALVAGWGYIGLAGVALVTAVLTAAALALAFRQVIGPIGTRVDPPLARRLTRTATPLMLNDLLNSVFFRIDAVLLKALTGDLALGWYSTAYRFIDGLQIIPSRFVPALFPLLSRAARDDRARFVKLYLLGSRVLLSVALPIAAGTTLLSQTIIGWFAGAAYLPDAGYALAILIWFLPLSFANGLTQYALIALGRQRAITSAFLLGAGFNAIANLLLIPSFGYIAACAITVLSEVVLFAPFFLASRDVVNLRALGAIAWRPAVATAIMTSLLWPIHTWPFIVVVVLGGAVYAGALWALGGITPEDRHFILARVRRR